MVWLSAMIFNSLEKALNIIFRSQEKRNYFVSKLLAISMIPMGWIVGITSIAISYVATLLIKQPALIAESFGFSLSTVSAAVLRYVVPYFITTLFFVVVYRVIPTARIRLSVIIAGQRNLCIAHGNSQAVFYLVYCQLYPLQNNFRISGSDRYSGYLRFLYCFNLFVLCGDDVVISASRYDITGKSNASNPAEQT